MLDFYLELFVKRVSPLTFRFSRYFLGRAIFAGLSLAFSGDILAQSNFGGDTPTGLAGSWGGSTSWSSGTYDFYERNLSHSVVDMTVPGSVIPFTYTRIWNSRNQHGRSASDALNYCPILGCRDNWSWGAVENYDYLSDTKPTNERFIGYWVHYPDGRVVLFGRPNDKDPPGTPGTYIAQTGILDRFIVAADVSAKLITSDGTVVNFASVGTGTAYIKTAASSIVDPHGLVVTLTYNASGVTITEPGKRWIRIGPTQADGTTTVTSSLGQTVTYKMQYNADNSATGTVTYNDVIDSATGQAVPAHYAYEWVDPPQSGQANPLPFDRLFWASDPMFDGPRQEVKFIYTPALEGNKSLRGDLAMNAIEEEHSASATDPSYTGVMVNKCEMGLFPDYDTTTGYNEDYWTRIQIRGDGMKRTISYFSNATGRGQNLVDRVTDWTNNPNIYERREYDWTNYFQTPIKITDMNKRVTTQTLEPVLGHITRETHPDPQQSHRDWSYDDPNNAALRPYYVFTSTDERTDKTTFKRDPSTHRVTEVDYPNTSSTAGIYPQTSYETFSYTPFGQIKTHRLTSGGTESFAYFPSNAGAKANCLQSWTNADNKTTLYDYDSLGRVSTVTDPRGASLGDPNYTTNYSYNGRHQVTLITLPKDPVAGQRYTIQKAYNDQTGTLASVTDELGHTTTYAYDGYKRVIWVRDATGQYTTTKYGPWKADGTMMSPSLLTTNTPAQTISPMGKTINIYYDENLRKSKTLQAPGTADAAYTYFDYDNVGNLTKVTDGRGASLGDPNHTATYGYDSATAKLPRPIPRLEEKQPEHQQRHQRFLHHSGDGCLRQ